MEPNHITIHSKFKEYFGLQIAMKEWTEFLMRIFNKKSTLNKLNLYRKYFRKLEIV